MTDRLRMPRRRGAAAGTLLLIAGIWGALIPFVGPYFDWVIGPDDAFEMTEGRFWLSLVPGLAVVAGALILTGTANRLSAGTGAWLALVGGAWFVVGPTVSRLINDGASWAGEPLGGPSRQALETLTYYEGLGALIVALAALALGRMTVRDHAMRDDRAPAEEGARTRGGRFAREGEAVRGQEPPATVTAGRAGTAPPEADAGERRDKPIL